MKKQTILSPKPLKQPAAPDNSAEGPSQLVNCPVPLLELGGPSTDLAGNANGQHTYRRETRQFPAANTEKKVCTVSK